MTTATVEVCERSPYIHNPRRQPRPGDLQTPHRAECYDREEGLFPAGGLPFTVDTAPVDELRTMSRACDRGGSARILFGVVHLPTVRLRAIQHAEAYRRAAEALRSGTSSAPDARWFASQRSVAIRLAELILAEAKWTGSDTAPRPIFSPAGREVSDAWARLGAAYLWAARHLMNAAMLAAAADELTLAASRLECAVYHRRR